MTRASFRLPPDWPQPYDTGAAERLTERFAELGRAEARLAERPAVAAMLRSLGGNSPFLADLAIRESSSVRAIISSGPDGVVQGVFKELAGVSPAQRRDRI